MKINETLLNKLKIQSYYGQNNNDKNNRQVVNGGVEFWDKSSQATEILERYNVPKTEENKKGIEAFMKNTEGDTASKLETVEIAASNGIEMTEDNLSSIHEALHEDFELKESVEVLVVSEGEGSENLTAGDIEKMDLPSDMKASILKDMEKGTPPMKALAKAIEKTFGDTFLSKLSGKVEGDVGVTICITIEVIEIRCQMEGDNFDLQQLIDQFKALADVAKEGEGHLIKSAADLLAALGQMTDKLVDTIVDNENITSDDTGVAGESHQLERPMVEPLEDTMEDISEQIAQWVGEAIGSIDQVSQELMETFNTSASVKLYVVESLTVKMQESADVFKKAQKEMLTTMEKALGAEKNLTTNQIKEVLNTVINKLDDVLMKSDVPLYTSMDMEKNLLKMSSDLQGARQLLSKGDITGAKNIIKTVHGRLEAAVFKPSEKKIQGFALKQSEAFLQNKEIMQFQSYKQEGVSARNVLELFRSLGLNHEYEVSEKLAQLKTFEKDIKLEGNLKEVLYKMEQKEEKQEHKTIETIEKALNNLNGQQLLNKQGQKNSQQTLFFNIPMVSDDEIKNMKLYVNARDANNQLDWENCSLYFVIDLKTYGPTGIKVDIKDRSVSITVKNDNGSLKDVITPLIEDLGKAFEEVGLKEKEIHFLPLDSHKKFGADMLKDKSLVEEPVMTDSTYGSKEKGFDAKI